MRPSAPAGAHLFHQAEPCGDTCRGWLHQVRPRCWPSVRPLFVSLSFHSAHSRAAHSLAVASLSITGIRPAHFRKCFQNISARAESQICRGSNGVAPDQRAGQMVGARERERERVNSSVSPPPPAPLSLSLSLSLSLFLSLSRALSRSLSFSRGSRSRDLAELQARPRPAANFGFIRHATASLIRAPRFSRVVYDSWLARAALFPETIP